ncbi:hypothetical protein MHI48_29370 [Paenibacillus sp. FSL H7-0942]|uniref:DUF6973 domain-containing protein n=1 Tax=Paenibacillus amylolyticus TaxID=1451 RepID=A0ABD8ASR0_PAEAM|nr:MULTISPECIES: hypothetical protein [Paenibacillus]ETT35434.1 hypothetical protein C161_17304 [Paenibacillus sp. FSL R5-192]OME92460.1 hypothetical protein BK124_26630 [Paenibacillus amylolyticus]OMF03036.1 hypothetical protein BK129_23055 [Paenibacillus amylolyticus]
MKKVSLALLSSFTAYSIFASAVGASSISDANISAEMLESRVEQLAQTDFNNYVTINEFESELSSFLNNVVLVKEYQYFTPEEVEKWEILSSNFQAIQSSIAPAQTASTASLNAAVNNTYPNLQRDIEGAIVTSKYGAVVLAGVYVATDRANEEQQVYKNRYGFTTTQENEVDAFRHFSWNYHLTDTITITRGAATFIADNHEFSAFGVRYAENNFPTATAATKLAQGIYYTNKVKGETNTASKFKSLFVNSNFMDFNNNEAGRAYESKGYKDNYEAFAAAKSNGHVTTSPSQWTSSKLSSRAYDIYSGAFKY